MANVSYQSFLPEVMPHVQGAPEPQVVNAVRDAAVEFCERSWVWIADTAPIGVTAGTADYAIVSPDSNAAIAEYLYGYWNNKQVDPIARDVLDKEHCGWKTRTGTTPMKFMARDAMTGVTLIPIPSLTVAPGPTTLYFTVALKPLRSQASGVPDWLYEKYLEDIGHGAISRMQMITGQRWSNANAALAHKKLFDDAIGKARSKAAKSFTRAALRNRAYGVARW